MKRVLMFDAIPMQGAQKSPMQSYSNSAISSTLLVIW